MYLYAVCLSTSIFFVNLIVKIIGLVGKPYIVFCCIFNILVGILLGVNAKKLYVEFVTEKVKNYMNNPQYSPDFFALSGGVTWGVPFIVLLLHAFLIFVIFVPIPIQPMNVIILN